MKKFFLLLIIFTASAYGQTDKKSPIVMKPAPMEFSELASDLAEYMGMHSYKFRFDLDKAYYLNFFIDEYEKGQLVNHDDMPLQIYTAKRTFKDESGQNVVSVFETLRVLIIDTDKSNRCVAFNCGEYGSMSISLMIPVDDEMEYYVKPFSLDNVTPGKKIPLVLYGSAWQEGEAHRFCGLENVLSPEMNNETYKLMPRYFVVGITLEKNRQ